MAATALISQWTAMVAPKIVPNVVTENGMPAYDSTGSNCLDFFASVVRDTPATKVKEMFEAAYKENAQLALQILMNLRDCIGNGKQEKLVSLTAFDYLKMNKPRTYLMNLPGFVSVGCYKDLLKLAGMNSHPIIPDAEYQLFASTLIDDDKKLSDAPPESKVSISLAPKWAPTEGCEYDKKFKAAHKIAKLCKWNMKTYRKTLTKLRANLEILEAYESSRQWDKINFEHVPATAMKKQKKAFEKHCSESFRAYLMKVMQGKAKMNTKGIQPHELVRTYMHHMAEDATVDAQWKALISRLQTAGTFSNTMAVCDVSGSMSGVPLEVCIALGLVVSELTAPPFKNKVITFSAVPQWHVITGEKLSEKVSSLQRAHWEMNTDFLAVFKMLLAEAQTYSLKPEQMIKKIFVFTDMQFDNAKTGPDYGTGYDHVKEMYTKAGYKIPQIVFWNLRDTRTSFPVRKDTPGVALMSGFSAEMLKFFLDDKEMTPYSMMIEAVKNYKVIVVNE